MGTSEVAIVDKIEIPRNLKTVKIRVGEDMDGGFLAQIVFIGKTETVSSKSFNDWGHWEQVDLKYGELLVGIECKTFTDNGAKSFKSFKCIIGPDPKHALAAAAAAAKAAKEAAK